jgi:Zn-dependent protease with chaperone function
MKAVVNAIYYDGKSARPQRVTVHLDGDLLVVQGDLVERSAPLSNLKVSEPLGAAPRLITFPDSAHCEVREHDAFAQLLRDGNHQDSLVVRMQARWKWALVAVVLTVATGVAGYRWGLPAAAEWIAQQLPPKVLAGMGESSLKLLDQNILHPSNLTDARQQSLAQAFDKLEQPSKTAPAHTIVFRNGGPIGANAFALPNGAIVVTDQLVSSAESDEEILGVLSHELGHLERRHSLRMLIQGSIVGFVVAWYAGDVSNIAAGLPSALLQARYSRDFEREADAYAMQMMKLNGLSPSVLARMLQRMQANAGKKHPHGSDSDPFSGYLDSHPATQERIRMLESAN